MSGRNQNNNRRRAEVAGGEGPFGPAQTKLLKFLLKNPGVSKSEIHERLFNDKQMRYTDNLLYENSNLITKQTFDNSSMPTKFRINVEELSKLILIKEWLQNGTLVSNPQPA